MSIALDQMGEVDSSGGRKGRRKWIGEIEGSPNSWLMLDHLQQIVAAFRVITIEQYPAELD